MTRKEYNDYMAQRAQVISENRSRRMRVPQQAPLPVPPKIKAPMARVAYEANGTYYGRLAENEPIPDGMTVKLEEALW